MADTAVALDDFAKRDSATSPELLLPLGQPESQSNAVPVVSPTSLPYSEDASIFDVAIRHELLRIAKQDELVNEIVTRSENSHKSQKSLSSSVMNLLCPSSSASTSLALGLLLPTILPHDRGNLLEIVMYTFGSFFAECLCCELQDVRVLTISAATQFIKILREAMGAVVAFEGAVALLRLSFQEADQCVFQASLHLAQTIFQQHTGFLDDLPDESVLLGLRNVAEALLANPCCWRVTTTGTRTPASRPVSTSSVKRRISLELLTLVWTLVGQEKTRLSFYKVLLPVASSSNQCRRDSGSKGQENALRNHVTTSNRLRLIRLLLQRHRARLLQIPSRSLTSMQHYCEETQDAAAISAFASSSSSREQARLARECLILLLHSDSEQNRALGKFTQLASIYVRVSKFESSGERVPSVYAGNC